MATIVLDAGHGGSDPGAVYQDRLEKDDNLALTLAVGDALSESGIKVLYTRTTDMYDTPTEKALEANATGADYFISIHRNSSPSPNQFTGVETLVYSEGGASNILATNINKELEKVGFTNLGVEERPNLAVLKRTTMPAILIELGFINTEADNLLFDQEFDAIVNAIVKGVLTTIKET